MLGMRDAALRRELNVASLADRGVLLATRGPSPPIPRRAGSPPARGDGDSAGWWLHVDVDVLAQAELAASRVPGDEDASGGLTWEQLTEALSAASAGGCRGWSISIYDPDQDPGGGDARGIVQLVRAVAPLLGRLGE